MGSDLKNLNPSNSTFKNPTHSFKNAKKFWFKTQRSYLPLIAGLVVIGWKERRVPTRWIKQENFLQIGAAALTRIKI
jgi:hypothetical protein